MLILIRKVNQGVWLSGDICMAVLDIKRGRVKLGVTAPDRVKVSGPQSRRVAAALVGNGYLGAGSIGALIQESASP